MLGFNRPVSVTVPTLRIDTHNASPEDLAVLQRLLGNGLMLTIKSNDTKVIQDQPEQPAPVVPKVKRDMTRARVIRSMKVGEVLSFEDAHKSGSISSLCVYLKSKEGLIYTTKFNKKTGRTLVCRLA